MSAKRAADYTTEKEPKQRRTATYLEYKAKFAVRDNDCTTVQEVLTNEFDIEAMVAGMDKEAVNDVVGIIDKDGHRGYDTSLAHKLMALDQQTKNVKENSWEN
eukprot:5879994-Amphidinium_carterae.1